ncbi:3-carboxy-cis,cis-muconate cycloisomerase [Brevundimonas sp. S30B]|uniref:3-carboxy-cis,cis-muconate cycloisomerase n=1 Tax=unclassified Brevundimonas TaxID=2622653 RepID=UPI00107288B9|nr:MULTISPECIES: 3-carboxy-cis,cis-muconate cycloisomerase [unclassified Brevundimonas]QBX36658.1 3-carboxy-cis,cis-muconate cycloisomerase [Brevundimonas sp. MF30-B]TFW04547.1 3-carboxy-cis,cis-muconate cycloisomerase [Brevundimonas sp. S30B]
MTSVLTASLFSTPSMDVAFGDDARLQAMLDAEAALARAQAGVGLIPAGAAPAIERACQAELYDLAALGRAVARAANPAIPLVTALMEHVARIDPDSAAWVHHGATSQDIIDTGLVLQVRRAWTSLAADLDRVDAALVKQVQDRGHHVLAGRTLLQHALPTTFGLKAAGWLDSARRARRAVQAAIEDLPPQLGGAAGTLASMGGRGPAVLDGFAAELGLTASPSWHARRERIALLGSVLAILVGVLAKAALDISLMMATETSEAFEVPADGGGGSSAMPHKRNPVAVTAVLAASRRAPGLAATLMMSLPQAHERDVGGWHAEWEVVPDLFRLAGGAAARMADVFEGLRIDADRMAANLEMTRGLLFSEAAAVALTGALGRAQAHARVKAAAARVVDEGITLRQALEANPGAAAALAGRWDEVFDLGRTVVSASELERRLVGEP